MSDRVLYVYGLPENLRYSLLRSPQWAAASELLEQAGTRAQWSRIRRGWLVRTERVGDVLAVAENGGFRVDMRGPLEVGS